MRIPLWTLSLTLAAAGGLAAADPRAPAAKAVGPAGSFAVREADGKDWKASTDGGQLFTGDTIVATPGAVLEAPKGVRLTSRSNIEGTAPHPVLETSLVLRANPAVDLDFVFHRGFVELANLKKSGPATVQITFRDQNWQVELGDGARVAMILYTRWPNGVPFSAKPKPGHEPAAYVDVVALAGSAEVNTAYHVHRLKAAPGPALFEWDSGDDHDRVRRLEKLPDWAEAPKVISDRARKALAARDKFRDLFAKKSLAEAIDALDDSEDSVEQYIAMVVMGATDNLVRLGQILSSAHDEDQWDFGIRVVRHWISRSSEADRKLYQLLISERMMKPGEAGIVMHLLHDFSEAERTYPETYETLIDYLRDKNPAIRNLAAWHLNRLAPTAKIGFKPNQTADETEKLYQEWKKHIPTGKVPPKVSVEEPKKVEKGKK